MTSPQLIAMSSIAEILSRAEEAFAPTYSTVIEVEFFADISEQSHGWIANPSHRVVTAPANYSDRIRIQRTTRLIPLVEESTSFPSLEEWQAAVGRLVIVRHLVATAPRTAIFACGPRRLLSVEPGDADHYIVSLCFAADVIAYTDPPEVLQYGFHVNGRPEGEVSYKYITDDAGGAVLLVPEEIEADNKKLWRRQKILYEWLRALTLHPASPFIASVFARHKEAMEEDELPSLKRQRRHSK